MSPSQDLALGTDLKKSLNLSSGVDQRGYDVGMAVADFLPTRREPQESPAKNKESLPTATIEKIETQERKIVPHAQPEAPLIRDETLQEWEGRVLRISDNVFEAALTDVTARSEIEEELAEFPLRDVREEDLPLLREGSVFRWIISYIFHKGTKARASRIIFRRRNGQKSK